MSGPNAQCGNCRFFIDDPVAIERALPGLLALSSGQGDSRGDQGLCEIHDRYLVPRMTCTRFEPRPSRPHGRP